MIACSCPVCTSPDPRDKRNRCSLMLEYDEKVVVVDTAPEFRLQCVALGIQRVDALLFTHTHADHIFGLDDVRRFCSIHGRPIPCYGTAKTIRSLKTIFSYAFDFDRPIYSEIPRLEAREVAGPFDLFGREVIPLELMHGREVVLGFRIGSFAYCTDCSAIPDRTMEQLRGLDVLVLDALRYTPHPTHFNVDQALAAAGRIGAKKTYLTHIAHEILHADLAGKLPESVFLAYDGLEETIG